jgi:hypothetical protein
MNVLLGAMHRLDPKALGVTAADLVAKAKEAAEIDLKAAVEDLVGRLDGRQLGYKLRSFLRRNFNGLMVDRAGTAGGSSRWAAVPVAPPTGSEKSPDVPDVP